MRITKSRSLLAVVLGLGLLFMAPLSAEDADKVKDKGSTVEQVRKALLSLPYYGVYDFIEFQVNDRTVTLLGQVTRPTLKNDAEAAVHGVRGVEEVVNKIEVLPLSSVDDNIRRAVYQTVYSQPGLTRYALGANPSIHIIVKNGNVTLKGIVNSQGDKDLAGIQARNVGGTFAVNNELMVEESKDAKAEKKAEE